jgi:hypothetical protein
LIDGAAVLFSSGVFLINILALSLLFYRHNRLTLTWAALAFLFGSVFNLLFIQDIRLPATLALATPAILLLFLGSMILSGHRFHQRLVIFLSFLVASLSNMESSVTDFALGGGFVLAAVGIFILSAAFVQLFSTRIRPIVVRVGGSWITAVALIYIAYHFK